MNRALIARKLLSIVEDSQSDDEVSELLIKLATRLLTKARASRVKRKYNGVLFSQRQVEAIKLAYETQSKLEAVKLTKNEKNLGLMVSKIAVEQMASELGWKKLSHEY